MGVLQDLADNKERRNEFNDFVTRYEQGNPAEGYSDREVLERYSDVAHAVPPDQYKRAAEEALARLSPQEREALVRLVQDRAQARGVALPPKVESEPSGLSNVLTDLHGIPGQLRELFGGSRNTDTTSSGASLSNMFSSPLAKAVLAGITAMVAKRLMQGR